MKLSYNWLNEYIKIDDIDPHEVALRLTMSTSEIESVEPVGDDLEKIVVGKIVDVKPHPDSDHLFCTKIDAGKEILDIVSGAPNTKKNTYVPVALIGARLPGGHAVKRVKLRGVESFGVVCSERELGASDDHSGLWLLDEEGIPEAEMKPGTPFASLFPTRDYIIEIDNKSLTNRPDLWGHYGFVRELAAIFKRTARPVYPRTAFEMIGRANGSKPVTVEIQDPDLCPRYSAIRMRPIRFRKSPYSVRRRLFTLGVRPISAVVDVTNYIMLHTGQPLHAFDGSRIAKDTIVVRRARDGEEFYTLDGVLRKLTPETLLITDPKKAVAVAGVMGGLNSEIEEGTEEIIIESANFNPVSIRRTALRLGLRTEASNRFEKSLDPELTISGIVGAVSMITELLPESEITSPLADADFSEKKRTILPLDTRWVSKLIGTPINKSRIISIMESLGFQVEDRGKTEIRVGVPSYRANKDITIPQDCVEEIGRVYGYGNITPVLPPIESSPPPKNEELYFIRMLKSMLSRSLFATEVYTYSFVDGEAVELFYSDETEFVRLKNPVSTNLSRLRRSLLPNLYQTIEKNSTRKQTFSVYEIGSVYNPPTLPAKAEVDESHETHPLPEERHRLCMLMLEEAKQNPVFFALKGRLEILLDNLYLDDTEFLPFERIGDYEQRIDFTDYGDLENYHSGRRALMCRGKTAFGVLAELNPRLVKRLGIDFHAYRAAFFELDIPLLSGLAKAVASEKKYVSIPKFPEVVLAFAVVVDEDVAVQDVRRFLLGFKSEMVEDIKLFDIYRGRPLPEGKKNLAFNVYYRLPDRTLTEAEANVVHEKIAQKIREHGWELR
jgi:phenylalanyl-tRNA synthetase beta chain